MQEMGWDAVRPCGNICKLVCLHGLKVEMFGMLRTFLFLLLLLRIGLAIQRFPKHSKGWRSEKKPKHPHETGDLRVKHLHISTDRLDSGNKTTILVYSMVLQSQIIIPRELNLGLSQSFESYLNLYDLHLREKVDTENSDLSQHQYANHTIYVAASIMASLTSSP